MKRIITLIFILMSIVSVLWWLFYPNKVNSGPYLDSAHGNSSYGVNRLGLSTFGYSKGNCSHCHEQHASIGGTEPDPSAKKPSKYLLFRTLFSDQRGNFCLACHRDPGDSEQISMPNQYNYSRIAGGDNNSCPDSIWQAFVFITDTCTNASANCGSTTGSAHCLEDIQTDLRNKWGWGPEGNVNPCSGCHNTHRVQRDPHNNTSERWPNGKLASSVSKPSQHIDSMTWELWGDDPQERMSYKASASGATYCAPYQYNSTTTREPDGCSAPATDCSTDCSNGSNLTDYVTLCTDCHNLTNAITSTRLGRRLTRIDWSVNGDIHGAASTQKCCDFADKKEPYYQGGAGETTNYILSCIDCHEPHGSPNEYLLRPEVNGSQVPVITDSGSWWYLCSACHQNLSTKHLFGGINDKSECWGCHRHRINNYDKPPGCTGCSSTEIKTF